MTITEDALSVLSADLAGAARLRRHLDKPEALYAVQRCDRRLRRSVESHGGRLVNCSGSKLMAFFSDGVAALQSAVEMQHRISDLPPHSGFPLAIRVGVCTGHQTREGRFFPGEGANPAASLSTVAAPGHILLSVPRRAKFFPWSQLAPNSMPDLELSCGNRRLGVFQVPWQQRDPASVSRALTELANVAGRLCVRYKGAESMLDERQPVTRIGRQPDCDLSLRDTRCSRQHGRIERRLDCFVFVDQSTNGTFVTLEDQVEFRVHRQEIALFGRGQLAFGAPAAATGVELLQFQTAGFSR